ncbi:CSS-motif domain-containing protein [Pseudomonas wayambapalatensis]|uniref:CSS-motif domain-containing protein n=1 Tax=Pseudomonas TaxID=286 RepID=UPI001644B385|nr:CSS-motif domain-containing protein [Pseudomonas sp. RW3S2]MBC3419702.1 CSS-motif domain-containing protein [Pseudomonas sp. RW3S2]QXI41460.1 CSS-motif domain-containing protein [Pseudomonas wayambapalatensis]
MSISRHLSHRMTNLMVSMLIGTAPVISGLVVMDYQLNKQLEENAKVSIEEAVFAIDRVFDSLHRAALHAQPLGTRPCKEVQQELESQARRNPRVHSLVLTRNDAGFCSSLGTKPLHTPRFAKGEYLRLNMNSPTIPNGVLVEYRLVADTHAVIASTYGLELRNELRGFKDGLVLLLEFGGLYLWAEGDSRDAGRPSLSEFPQNGVSEKYGYMIRAGYPAGFTAREARQVKTNIMPSLVLIGLFTSVLVLWSLLRNRNPVK